jgi:hypothetical protein
MIAFFDPADKRSQAQFLLLMSEGIERIRDPERYIQLREARMALEKFRDSTEDGSEERRAVNIAIDNVRGVLVQYEDADPNQIVNDFLARS